MSIASRINEIGVHLTKDWRSIEALTGEAEVDKNIENIASVLDNLWEEMPKVTGTGESLTLNTKKGKMKVNLLGNTSQYSTTGKNTFNNILTSGSTNGITYTVNEDKSVKFSGTASALTFIILGSWNLSGNYIFSGIADGSNSTYWLYLSGTLSNLVTITNEEKPVTNDGTSYNVVLRIGEGKTINETLYPMIRPSSVSDDTYEPYTGEQPSPSPSYPQQIHEVSGDNEIVVCGKNLFDDSVKNGKWINTNGSWSTSAEGSNLLKVECSSGDVFSLSATFESGSASDIILIAFFDENDNMLSRNVQATSTSPSLTRTAPSNTAYMWAGHYTSAPLTIQLERGEATTYEPYQSQTYPINLGTLELCKIGDYQDYFTKNSGKNLVEATLEHSNLNSSGTIVGGSGEVYDLHIAKVIEGQNYTLTTQESGADIVLGFFNTKPIMSSQTYNQKRVITRNTTFTAPITGYVAFRSTTGYATPMLNEGSTALPYEPYGNGDWYLEKKIGKIVLDGSEDETWFRWATNTFYITKITDVRNALSNYYTYNSTATGAGQLSNGEFFIHDSINNNVVIFKNTGINDSIEAFKIWLSTHNTIVYYVLATPTYTQITGTLKDDLEAAWRANSYKDTTNISQVNNDLPFNLSVTALGSE